MEARQRWESIVDPILQVAAVIFLVAYAAPIVHPGLPGAWDRACSIVVIVTWILFGVDYLVRLVLAKQRWRWFYRNLFSLVILVVPILRPLRLLRLVTLLSVVNRSVAGSLRGKVTIYAAGGVVLLVICGALAITDAERGRPGSSINSFGDGVWWAVTTIATVGYGDTHPVTATGRGIAICLMAGGVALLGVVTGTFASWLIQQVSAQEETAAYATVEHIDRMERKIDALTAQVERLNATRPPGHGGR